MKISELLRYTKKLLKGRSIRTGMICILPLCAALFFRCAEAAVYSLLLYFGEMTPLSLFGGKSPVCSAASLIFTLLRWITVSPLMYATAFRLYEICSEKAETTPLSEILLSRTAFRRSLGAVLLSKIISFAALIPTAFLGVLTFSMLKESLNADETFAVVNTAFLTLVSFLMWLSLRLSLAAVPFLMVRYPQKSIFRTVFSAVRFMSGRKGILLRLAAVYILPSISIVGLPFAATRFLTAFALSTDIFNREDEYNKGIKAESRIEFACDITELSN